MVKIEKDPGRMVTKKYNATVLLTGLFCRFKLKDKKIRIQIANLYMDLITEILSKGSNTYHVKIFQSLIPAIKATIEYLEGCKYPDPTILDVFKQLINHCIVLVNESGVATVSDKIVNEIVRQAFITDIGCVIGDCIINYKNSKTLKQRKEILMQLKVYLKDYNEVMHTYLTARKVLGKEKSTK